MNSLWRQISKMECKTKPIYTLDDSQNGSTRTGWPRHPKQRRNVTFLWWCSVLLLAKANRMVKEANTSLNRPCHAYWQVPGVTRCSRNCSLSTNMLLAIPFTCFAFLYSIVQKLSKKTKKRSKRWMYQWKGGLYNAISTFWELQVTQVLLLCTEE